ncbi:MAG: serine hydrolase domain-containing protein [Planctomycetia bacterium]
MNLPARLTFALGLVLMVCASAYPAESKKPTPKPYDPAALDKLVPKLMEKYQVPGVSIAGIEDGRVVWDRQYGVCRLGGKKPVTKETVFEACSMTKPMFGYMVMGLLVEPKKLDLDRPLVEYLDEPYLKDEPLHKKITARMVLSHTTGFPNWREGGWRSGNPLPVRFEPGTKFGYSGEGLFYLQQVAEHITGQSGEVLMRKHLFDPLGMKISSYVWEDRFEKLAAAGHDRKGKPRKKRRHYVRANAGYSLYTTPCEYATFLTDVMREDRSKALVRSQETIDAMFRKITKATGRKPIRRAGKLTSDDVYWGLGWELDSTSLGDRIYHSGTNGSGFRCYHEFDLERKRGIVIMTNSLTGNKLWEAILAEVAP